MWMLLKTEKWVGWNFIMRRIELPKLGELIVNCIGLERWIELQRAPKSLVSRPLPLSCYSRDIVGREEETRACIFCAHCPLRTVQGMFIYVICGFQSAWSAVFPNISFHKPNVSNSSCDGETWKKRVPNSAWCSAPRRWLMWSRQSTITLIDDWLLQALFLRNSKSSCGIA